MRISVHFYNYICMFIIIYPGFNSSTHGWLKQNKGPLASAGGMWILGEKSQQGCQGILWGRPIQIWMNSVLRKWGQGNSP